MLPDIEPGFTMTVERQAGESGPTYSRMGAVVPAWSVVQTLTGRLYELRERDEYGRAGRVLVGQFVFVCDITQYVPRQAGNPFDYETVTADVRAGDRLSDAQGALYRVDGAIDVAGDGDHLEVALTRYRPEEPDQARLPNVGSFNALGNDPGDDPGNDPGSLGFTPDAGGPAQTPLTAAADTLAGNDPGNTPGNDPLAGV